MQRAKIDRIERKTLLEKCQEHIARDPLGEPLLLYIDTD